MSGGGIPVTWQSIVTLFPNITVLWSKMEACGGIKWVLVEIFGPSLKTNVQNTQKPILIPYNRWSVLYFSNWNIESNFRFQFSFWYLCLNCNCIMELTHLYLLKQKFKAFIYANNISIAIKLLSHNINIIHVSVYVWIMNVQGKHLLLAFLAHEFTAPRTYTCIYLLLFFVLQNKTCYWRNHVSENSE